MHHIQVSYSCCYKLLQLIQQIKHCVVQFVELNRTHDKYSANVKYSNTVNYTIGIFTLSYVWQSRHLISETASWPASHYATLVLNGPGNGYEAGL